SLAPICSTVCPQAIAADPLGQFLFVVTGDPIDMTNPYRNQKTTADPSLYYVSSYRIEPTTGLLTPAGAAIGGNFPFEVTATAVDPTGHFLVASDIGRGALMTFEVDPVTGALSQGPEMTLSRNPLSVAIDPTSHFVCGGMDDNSVWTFAADI